MSTFKGGFSLTKWRCRRGHWRVREVAVRPDTGQVELTFRMNVQATLAKLANGKGFAGRGRVNKFTGIASRAIREELATLQYFTNGTAYRWHGHRAENWRRNNFN